MPVAHPITVKGMHEDNLNLLGVNLRLVLPITGTMYSSVRISVHIVSYCQCYMPASCTIHITTLPGDKVNLVACCLCLIFLISVACGKPYDGKGHTGR